MKHSVVAVEDMDHVKRCQQLIKEIEEMGGVVPAEVDKSQYV